MNDKITTSNNNEKSEIGKNYEIKEKIPAPEVTVNTSSSDEKISLVISSMTVYDVPDLRLIEKECFDEPWPRESYEKELKNTSVSRFFVAKQDGVMLGYVGAWHIIDELHVVTIGVTPRIRGRKIGLCLVWHLFNQAVKEGCRWSTLEVDVQNKSAIRLYERFGFKRIGTRKAYYSNGNDAMVMWVGKTQHRTFKEKLEEIRKEWEEHISAVWE